MDAVPKIRPTYLRDRRGRRRRVVLSLADYRKLIDCLEDANDLALIDEVRDEPTLTWEEVKAKLDAPEMPSDVSD